MKNYIKIIIIPIIILVSLNQSLFATIVNCKEYNKMIEFINLNPGLNLGHLIFKPCLSGGIVNNNYPYRDTKFVVMKRNGVDRVVGILLFNPFSYYKDGIVLSKNINPDTKLEFPKGFFEVFPYLYFLVLRGCNLKSIPDGLLKFSNLKSLILDQNPIESLPENIYHLTKLENLNLSETYLKSLPSSIGKLSNINSLNLYNTLIDSLPNEFFELTSLSELDLSNITNINGSNILDKLSSMRFLHKFKIDEAGKGKCAKYLWGSSSRLSSLDKLPPGSKIIEYNGMGSNLGNRHFEIHNDFRNNSLVISNPQEFNLLFNGLDWIKQYFRGRYFFKHIF